MVRIFVWHPVTYHAASRKIHRAFNKVRRPMGGTAMVNAALQGPPTMWIVEPA